MLQSDDLLKFIDLVANIRRAGLSVFVKQLHFIELLIDGSHHLKHHSSVLIEHILFDISRALRTRRTLAHHVIDDVADLLLVFLKNINLSIHHLSLSIHQTLWHNISILRLQKVLPHFINKSAHFLLLVLRHFFQLRFLEAACCCGGGRGIIYVFRGLSLSDMPLPLFLLHLIHISFWHWHSGLKAVGLGSKKLSFEVLLSERELLSRNDTRIVHI